MELYKLGLTFNLIGSVLLGLHILGKKRLKKWEEIIKKVPHSIGDHVMRKFMGGFLEHKVKHSPYAQRLMKSISNKLHGSSEDDTEIKEFLYHYILPGLFISGMVFMGLSPIFLFFYLIVKPLYYLQEKLKIESFLGLLGILFLFFGYLLRILE